MSKVTDYRINGIDSIKEYLDKGWQLWEAPFCFRDGNTIKTWQAMVKYEEEPRKVSTYYGSRVDSDENIAAQQARRNNK